MFSFPNHATSLIHKSRTKAVAPAKKSHSHDSFTSCRNVVPPTVHCKPAMPHSASVSFAPSFRPSGSGGVSDIAYERVDEHENTLSDAASTTPPRSHSPNNEEYQILDEYSYSLQTTDPLPKPLQPSSSHTSISEICRICHCEGSAESPLITPCYCAGTLRFIHQKCLQQWIKASETQACEVCRYSFHMDSKVKPFRKWEKLSLSSVERRKVLCSLAFHIVAIGCVVWSLYVLIQRTAEEITKGDLKWPFWTKLVVVAIGFTGGLVFMYVQCKMYIQLFRRWKAYNKIIYVQNCPEATLLCRTRESVS